MKNLKIPYGLSDSGELALAKHAIKNNIYKCPCCGVQLIHRSGEVRIKHFAHPPSSNCNLESILHITAKRLIRDAIKSNATGQKLITLCNHCKNCGVEFKADLPPRTFTNAKEEVRVGSYICDVAGYRDDKIGLAIEILHTHEVHEEKAKNLPVYWIELKAEDVIANEYQWSPTQSHLKESYCTCCRNHIKHVLKTADKWGIDRSLYSAIKDPEKSIYIADTETCFKCNMEIPIFWWHGVPFCETDPPNPKPRTIKYRNSKQYGGSYWANTCANCNMIQGDNFLYIFKNAPFKQMPLTNRDSQTESALVRIVEADKAEFIFGTFLNRTF